ncbi:MAG: MotA/TolQ/ExbB proton channel family protein [Pirellula sp.]
MGSLYDFVGRADYYVLAAVALWGLFSLIMVWTRLSQKRFKSEEEQERFLDGIDEQLKANDFDSVLASCDGDQRAIPMMIGLAVRNRHIEQEKLESWVMDRFQFEVLSDIESRVTWISTLIKAAPMLGLIGTVAGMMGAFETLETATAEEPTRQLLADIRMALEHTLIGLLITVALLIGMAPINNRIRQLEELTVFGMNRFFDRLRECQQPRKLRVR